jgi:hypothetical protein
MLPPPNRPLTIEVKLPSSHPQLLAGLDELLYLGLISDAQVRKICRLYLTCEVVLQPQTTAETITVTQSPTETQFSTPLPPTPPAQPSFVTTMLQSLGAELSVRWLLFLGVFLVVVSSGVLAASQWQRFPAVGQYGVLFAYTLSFCGFSFWAGNQSNLRLTAQTLLMVTLLLVPMNFWAMDSFALWQNPVNWIVMAIASLTLTFMTVNLCKNRSVITNFPTGKLPLINILGLSYLHWGWKLPIFPLIAIYLAMIGTAFITVYKNGYFQPNATVTQANEDEQNPHLNINPALVVIVYALSVLLLRAIFVAAVNVTQLGLAIGICGWLMIWLTEKNLTPSSPPFPKIWQQLGGFLLLLGWLITVLTQPVQAILVSGLSLGLFSYRLKRHSLEGDLAAIFFVGLQTIWLGWRLVPTSLQDLVIVTGTNFTHSQTTPWALLSLALFPYVIFMVVLTDNLYNSQRQELATFGQQLALLLGVCLTTVATINPILRTLNLLFSTFTLAFVLKRRQVYPNSLIYLTHITAILAVCSTINWLFPNLNEPVWATILLGLMVAEWTYSLGEGVWRQSAWYIGLALATFSFALFWATVQTYWFGIGSLPYYLPILWFITPITLTFLASRTNIELEIINNSFVSVVAVGIAQLLSLPLPENRLIGLAVGTVVMFVNTGYLRNHITAGITVSFGLSLIAASLWHFVPQLTVAGWLMVGAITTLSLWLGRKILLRQNHELANIYAVVFDKLALALCICELLSLTVHSSLVYQKLITAGIFYLIATTITLAAIIYRTGRQPTNWAFYGIGWCLELFIAEVLGFGERSIIQIAIANIALGLFSQFFGEWWRRRYQLENLPSSFNILPLLYGAFSIILRLATFTNWTGFCSLGVALIVIGVGRRRTAFKPLVYLGIIGVSISAYELLFYQMSQAKGGVLADGLIAMSALGVSIMYAYRILAPLLINYLRLTPGELTGIAHLHWVWSSCLLLSVINLPIQVNYYLAIGTATFLIRYAIFQGRKNPLNVPETRIQGIATDEIWVYLGLLQAGIFSILLQNIPVGREIAQQLLPWQSAIACVGAYLIYSLPWENWRWSKTPWQQAAYLIPLLSLGQTRLQVHPITLIIVAGFYILLALSGNRKLRLTYISVVLVDWALFRWFASLNLTGTLWYVTLIGLSILYIAQIDEQLKSRESKSIRHNLRILGSGLICGWAIFWYQDTPYIPGIFSLIGIFTGLALRIRAFLYVGTATFLITSIYQMVIFSFTYPFLKWIVGLLVGILLISIAANFETRRAQINSLIRSISDEFQQWE